MAGNNQWQEKINKAKNEPSEMGNGGRDEDTLYPPVLAPAFVSSFFPFPRQLHSGALCLRNLHEKKKTFLLVSLMTST